MMTTLPTARTNLTSSPPLLMSRVCVSLSRPSHALQQIGDGMRHGRRIPAPGGPPLPAKQRPGGEIDREAPHPVPPEVYARERSRGARDRHTLAPAGQPAVKEPAEECFLGNRRDASSREGKPCARSRRVHGEHPGGRERCDADGGDAPPPGATPLAARRSHRDGDPQHAGGDHHSPPGHRRQGAHKQRRAPGRQGRDPEHAGKLKSLLPHCTTIVDTTITRGLNGKWSLATYSACRRCAPLATSTSWSSPYVIDTICPSTSRWICPSSGARRVVVSWMIRPAFSASRTRSLVLVMTDPGNGSRICSAAVERGRGWFTAGAVACLARMPQPAASTTMPITTANAAREMISRRLRHSDRPLIPTKFCGQKVASCRIEVSQRALRPVSPKARSRCSDPVCMRCAGASPA